MDSLRNGLDTFVGLELVDSRQYVTEYTREMKEYISRYPPLL